MKIIAIFFTLVIFASCSPFGLNPEGYEILSEPLEIAWPKAAAIEYVNDGYDRQWKSPHQTLNDGFGDCADIATLLVYYLGKQSEMVCINFGAGSDHAIVRYHGKYLEPQQVNKYYDESDFIITMVVSYNEAMALSTNNGRLSL